MLDDACVDGDSALGEIRFAPNSEFTRTEFVNGVKGEKVANFDVAHAGNGEKITWSEDVAATEEGRDDVVGWL